MPILIVVASVEPHNWNGIGGEGVEIAGNAVGDSIFIELQGASDDDAVVLGIIAVIIALIEADDTTITKLDVGVRVGIEGREHIFDEQGTPCLIPDGIAEGYGIC